MTFIANAHLDSAINKDSIQQIYVNKDKNAIFAQLSPDIDISGIISHDNARLSIPKNSILLADLSKYDNSTVTRLYFAAAVLFDGDYILLNNDSVVNFLQCYIANEDIPDDLDIFQYAEYFDKSIENHQDISNIEWLYAFQLIAD